MRRIKNTKGTRMDDAAKEEGPVCIECDAEIECCAFCDGDDCSKAICYGCVIVAVGQEIPQLHEHGG